MSMIRKARSLGPAVLAVILSAMAAGAGAQSISLEPVLRVSGDGAAGGGDVGDYVDFDHDPSGGQHAVYYDRSSGDLRWAHRPSPAADWQVEIVDAAGNVGQWSSMDASRSREIVVSAVATAGGVTIELTTGSLGRAIVGGRIQEVSSGTWYDIAGLEGAGNLIEISTPFAGSPGAGAFRVAFYQPVIAYQAGADGRAMKLAHPTPSGEWIIETLDPVSGYALTGYSTSVGVDSAGTVHLAWQDRTTSGALTGRLRYGAYEVGAWSFQEPLPGVRVDGRSRLIVDKFDNVTILCRDADAGQFVVLQMEPAGDWSVARREGSGADAYAIDATYTPSDDVISAAYQSRGATLTEPATIVLEEGLGAGGTSRGWTSHEAIGPGVGWGSSLAVAKGTATGSEAIAFYDSAARNLMLARRTGSTSWGSVSVVDGRGDPGLWVSADVHDPSGDLFIAYKDVTGGALKLARNDGGTTSTIGYIDGVKTGTFSDCAVTSGETIIAYHHETEGTLRVARWPRGSHPSAGSDVVVDAASADVGEYVSMVLTPDERIVIVYYDRANTNLKAAFWNGSDWQTRTLVGEQDPGDPNVAVGEYCDLAINEDGTRLAYCYYDADRRGLVYAFADVPGAGEGVDDLMFTEAIIGAGEEYGQHASLAFGPDGGLHMAWFSGKTLSLWYGQVGGLDDEVQMVDDTLAGATGWQTDIAVNPQTGLPTIVYHDVTNSALRHAEWLGGETWQKTTLAAIGDTGFHPAIAFDPARGQQYIAFYDRTAGALKLALRRSGSEVWPEPLTLTTGGRGVRPSIAIDPQGRLAISFYDERAGDLLLLSTDEVPNVNRADSEWREYK